MGATAATAAPQDPAREVRAVKQGSIPHPTRGQLSVPSLMLQQLAQSQMEITAVLHSKGHY